MRVQSLPLAFASADDAGQGRSDGAMRVQSLPRNAGARTALRRLPRRRAYDADDQVRTSVRAKSVPLNSNGSSNNFARAYEKQSP